MEIVSAVTCRIRSGVGELTIDDIVLAICSLLCRGRNVCNITSSAGFSNGDTNSLLTGEDVWQELLV